MQAIRSQTTETITQLTKWIYLKDTRKIWETYLKLYQHKSLPQIPKHLHSEVFRWIVHGSMLKYRQQVSIKMLDIMKENNIKLNYQDYYNLLYLYFREGNYEKAHALFDVLINTIGEENNYYWATDHFLAIYTRICIMDHKFDTVLEIYHKARRLGFCNLDKTSINVIQAYGQLGNIESAEDIFDTIKGKFGILPFKKITQCYILNNRVEKIEPLYNEIIEMFNYADLDFFETLIDYYLSTFDKENVKIWLKRALETPFVYLTDEQIKSYLT